MFLMYSLASLPLIYVYSFSPKSELIGFIGFFVINIIGCFFDMILDFIAVFSQAQATGATSASKLTTTLNNLTWILVVLFPSVNLKRSLFNIRLKSNSECVSALNLLFFTDYSADESWMSLRSPGLGASFLIFWVQMIFWWIILILIENNNNIKLCCRRCCKRDRDLEQPGDKKQWNYADSKVPSTMRSEWDDDDAIMSSISTAWNDTVCLSFNSIFIFLF